MVLIKKIFFIVFGLNASLSVFLSVCLSVYQYFCLCASLPFVFLSVSSPTIVCLVFFYPLIRVCLSVHPPPACLCSPPPIFLSVYLPTICLFMYPLSVCPCAHCLTLSGHFQVCADGGVQTTADDRDAVRHDESLIDFAAQFIREHFIGVHDKPGIVESCLYTVSLNKAFPCLLAGRRPVVVCRDAEANARQITLH